MSDTTHTTDSVSVNLLRALSAIETHGTTDRYREYLYRAYKENFEKFPQCEFFSPTLQQTVINTNDMLLYLLAISLSGQDLYPVPTLRSGVVNVRKHELLQLIQELTNRRLELFQELANALKEVARAQSVAEIHSVESPL